MLVFVAGNLGTMGVGRAAIDIAASLAASGIDLAVITDTRLRPQRLRSSQTEPRWFVVPRPFPRHLTRHLPFQIAPWIVAWVQKLLQWKNLKKLDPDILLVNDSSASNALLKISGLSAKKAKVLIVHGQPDFYRSKGRNLDSVLEVMKEYSHFVFVSRRSRDDWRAFDIVRGRPCYWIHNCCDEESVARLTSLDRGQVRSKLAFPQDRLIAVCVASIQYHKGQDLLVDLLPQILKDVPNLVLYMVGPPVDRKLTEELQRHVERSGYDNLVHFLGFRQNALEYTYAADLLVLPSRTEGFGLAILEAMALRTPVIASDAGGIPELIDDGQTGLLFSHQHPMGLVSCFARMAADESERRAFADRAWEKYRSDFSAARHTERYAALIRDILEES